MPGGGLAALREESASFIRELRLAAAVKKYERRRISQGRAAEIAGMSRSEFIAALGRFELSSFQVGAEEIIGETERG
jgi:hypothetical protein